MSDSTFIIPVKIDSVDRKQNIEYVLKFLSTYFADYRVIIGDSSIKEGLFDPGSHDYFYFGYDRVFHKTKILNKLIRLVSTPYVVEYDCDVVCNPCQIEKALNCIRSKFSIFVYPYDGRCAMIDRNKIDITEFKEEELKKLCLIESIDKNIYYGGIFCFIKRYFESCGLENENFIGWGKEDIERYYRLKKYDFLIDRVKGVLYHLNHFRGNDSDDKSESYINNCNEFDRIINMERVNISSWKNYD